MDDKTSQEDEILAMKSIYEDNDMFVFNERTHSGLFAIKHEAHGEKYLIKFGDNKSTIRVRYLKPLMLDFHLPSDYPSTSPPKFKLSCHWLSLANLSKLCTKLDELWEQGQNTCILFTWISFLVDELFECLELCKDNSEILIDDKENVSVGGGVDERAIKEPVSLHLLENYDLEQEEKSFANAYFDCGVCMTQKPGHECFKFYKCDHVFCNECMSAYFETKIADGHVKSLTCPQDKCETNALPTQVIKLVGEDVYKRYDMLLLKDSLNNMIDIVYCPRVKCNCAVIPEETLARCPDCRYVFCSLCRQGYHGIEPCRITDAEVKTVCEKYINGDEQVRKELERKYGEKRIKRALEEASSMDLITSTSKKCPTCRSWVHKLSGCNKMTCGKCMNYFCWLCGKSLSKTDPYSHFNSRNSECFERLFEDIEQPAEEFIGELDAVPEGDDGQGGADDGENNAVAGQLANVNIGDEDEDDDGIIFFHEDDFEE